MTQPRKEFLTALFRILDDKEVPYCVLRNYDRIYDEGPSDVDLGVEPGHVPALQACLAEAAAAANHRLVLRARFVNLSDVYWHPSGGTVRIDLETEIRWRVFPLLSAKAVVTLRRRHRDFYIPHPRHESVILFGAALWRDRLSDRYRGQLARLYQELSGPEELRRTFRSAFGAAGESLAESQRRILDDPSPAIAWKSVRRSVIRHSLHDGANRRALREHVLIDCRRLWERLRTPAGISLFRLSSAQPARPPIDVLKEIFPPDKAVEETVPASSAGRPGIRGEVRRLYTLFKGGLFARTIEVSADDALNRRASAHPRRFYSSRAFVSVENSKRELSLGHVKTGFMAQAAPADGETGARDQLVRFIADVLERERRELERKPRWRGAFVVLVGLDGSGKTTVARTLCGLGPAQERFSRIRYFHWLPRPFGGIFFPLPEPGNIARKPPLRRGVVQSALSFVRLSKNLVWANLSYLACIRPLIRRGSLVLMDRYYYNYFLDPVSVKYYGPAWLLGVLRRFFPRPDLVLVLKAPPEVLLARKQELSRDELVRQSALLDGLPFDAGRVVELDAGRPPRENAREILRVAAEAAG